MTAWHQYKSLRCARCGHVGGFRPLPDGEARDAAWFGHRPAQPDEEPDTVIRVSLMRCVYCGSRDAVQGVWNEKHRDDKRSNGAIAADGLHFIPYEREESDDG